MFISRVRTFVSGQARQFLRSSRGNATMICSLAAIPVVGAAGIAIDYARMSRVQDEIQYAADAATLMAAGAKTLGGTLQDKRAAREAIARSYLTRALASLSDAKLKGQPVVKADDVSISVEVRAQVAGSLTNVFGMLDDNSADTGGSTNPNTAGEKGRQYGITVRSKASWKKPIKYICLLALNPSEAESLHVKGTADIKAKSCAVQVNSSSNSALYQNGNATIKAANIDVVGNYTGSNFTPKPSVGVNPFADPLAAKFATDFAAAFASAPVRTIPSAGGTTTIQPGRYNGTIRINNGGKITMAPGVYFIVGGQLDVRAGGDLYADQGVTIVFTESNPNIVVNNTGTRLNVQAGGNMRIKAPASGRFAGIAIAQHPNSRPGSQKSQANSIIGGGQLDLTGIVYFPKQTLWITGNGDVATNSPMFSIVADRIFVEGNGQLNIGQSADFEAAGLPALPSTGNADQKVALQ